MKHQDKIRPQKDTVECLVCEEHVYVGRNPKIGSLVTCHNCDANFQVIDIEPVLIDWPFDEDEDDEFDEHEDYDDDESYYDDEYDD